MGILDLFFGTNKAKNPSKKKKKQQTVNYKSKTERTPRPKTDEFFALNRLCSFFLDEDKKTNINYETKEIDLSSHIEFMTNLNSYNVDWKKIVNMVHHENHLTPLIMASLGTSQKDQGVTLAWLRFLLENGADQSINFLSSSNMTALGTLITSEKIHKHLEKVCYAGNTHIADHWTVHWVNYYKAIELLLDYGADASLLVGGSNKSPLIEFLRIISDFSLSSSTVPHNLSIVKKLISNNAGLNFIDSEGKTALIHLCGIERNNSDSLSDEKFLPILELILNTSSEMLNHVGNNGENALITAMLHKQSPEVLVILLEHGADISVPYGDEQLSMGQFYYMQYKDSLLSEDILDLLGCFIDE